MAYESQDRALLDNSVKAAQLEFAEEPMDDYYQHRLAGVLSRLRVRRIIAKLAPLVGKKVLEVGCEAGYVSMEMNKAGAKVFAFDIVEQALRRFKQKLLGLKPAGSVDPQLFMGMAQDIPVADGAFDAVVCTEVIEHAPYPDRVIGEIARVLKPGGILVLTFPNEKVRAFAYPIVKMLGINTEVENEVTLYSYSRRDMTEIMARHLRIERSFTIPFLVPFTFFLVGAKPGPNGCEI